MLHLHVSILTGAAVLILASTRCNADVLLGYRMGALAPQIQDPINTVAGDNLLAGAGVTLNANATIYLDTGVSLTVANRGGSTDLDTALLNEAWYTFNVTVGSSVTNLNLTSLRFNAGNSSAAGLPRGYAVFVTTPTTNDQPVQAATDLTSQRPNWGPAQEIPLSGFASLKGLTNGQVITFKFVTYSPATGVVIDFDNIALNGIANFTTNEGPLVITDFKNQTNILDLTWSSIAGKVYSVQYSLDFSAWSDLTNQIPAAAGTNKTSVKLDLSGAGAGIGTILLQYSMGQFGPQIQDATNTAAGSDLTKGIGLSLFNPSSLIAYPTSPSLATIPFPSTDLTTALANEAWFTFDLTVGSSVTNLSLTSLTFNAARGGGAQPRGYAVYVTTPTTTDQEVRGATDLTTQRVNWGPLQEIALTNFPSLQGLTNGQVVTFKIPEYVPAAGNSIDFDDMTVIGNISPAPVAPYVRAKQLFLRVVTPDTL